MKKIKKLGLFDLVMAGLGGVIGFEVFALLNYAYFQLAGPDLIIALMLGGAINFLIMLSYCELSAALPKVGGEYTFIKTAYGGYIAFISGCFRWLASVFGAALATVSFVLQLSFLFSFVAPEVQNVILTQIPLIAATVVLAYGIFEARGAKKFGDIVNVMLIIFFAFLIVGGLTYGLRPVEYLSKPTLEGFSGVFAATVYVFPMFFGMRALIASASSAKRPGKDIPRALLLSALLIIPLYLFLAFVTIGIVPPEEIAVQVPLISYAAQKLFGNIGGVLFAIAGMVACLSGLGTALTVQSSIARGMSRDGYFPKILLKVHSRFGTNYVAILTGSLVIMFLSTLGAVPFLGYAAGIGSLFVFALVNLSLMKLRREKPYMERPFKTPLYPLTPMLGVFLSFALLITPTLLGDPNAIDALIAGVGLTFLVIVTYYLRMAGRYRLQIALGGIGVGVGTLLAILSLLSIGGFFSAVFPFVPSYVQLFLSAILIVTGYFNFSAGAKKEKTDQTSEENRQSKQGLRERLAKRLKLAV